ncbi:hypothetical protein EYC58_00255 [Candidatus Saccharibacteria bacterium]|nr:MAG: hypothetical protein EYC58_00255 [Candidatus Saccharibacteria bacterium]
MSEHLPLGEPVPGPSRVERFLGWVVDRAAAHLQESWKAYEQETEAFNRLSEQSVAGAAMWYGVRANIASRRAFHGDEDARVERVVGLAPERKRHVTVIQQMVDSAFGEASAPSLWGGYKQGTLNVHKDLGEKTHVFARGLTSASLNGVTKEQLEAVGRMVPLGKGHTIKGVRFSGQMQHPLHLQTVQNLFAAAGQTTDTAISAYRYVRISRGEERGGQLRRIPAGKDFLPIETFIVGFKSGPKGKEVIPGALLSLASSSVEILAMLDKGIRMEPGTELPDSSISAITRVHDLVMSDLAMQRTSR